MEIEYSLTFQDMEALARYHHHKQRARHQLFPAAKRALWIPVFGVLVAAIIQVYFFFGPKLPTIDTKWWDAFWSGLFVGFLLSCLPLLLITVSRWQAIIKYAVRKAYNNEKSRWMFAPQRMRIEAGGFSIVSENHYLSYSWAVVCEIDSTADHAFFYTTPNQAHVFPGRAFRDRHLFEEFIARARQYQQSWNQERAKPTGIIAGLPLQSDAFTRLDAP
jgi:hypothetical protein